MLENTEGYLRSYYPSIPHMSVWSRFVVCSPQGIHKMQTAVADMGVSAGSRPSPSAQQLGPKSSVGLLTRRTHMHT